EPRPRIVETMALEVTEDVRDKPSIAGVEYVDAQLVDVGMLSQILVETEGDVGGVNRRYGHVSVANAHVVENAVPRRNCIEGNVAIGAIREIQWPERSERRVLYVASSLPVE